MVGANGGEEVVGEAPETGKGVIGRGQFRHVSGGKQGFVSEGGGGRVLRERETRIEVFLEGKKKKKN